MNYTVTVTDEGDAEEYSAEAYSAETRSHLTVSRLAHLDGLLAEGRLATDDAFHDSEHVAERAAEEDVFAAEVRIPGWFVRKDEEVRDAFSSQIQSQGHGALRVTALVEDYSEKAWRVVASRRTLGGDAHYDYAWCFLPKSIVTVTRVNGVASVEDAWAVRDAAREGAKAARDAHEDAWEEAKEEGWEAMLDQLDAADAAHAEDVLDA